MATLVKTIKSRSTGDIIYPVTKADAVYFNDNNTLVSVQGKINTIQGLLGSSSSISNVGSSITGIIGNEALTTTAQTLAGAINEHQTDINTLNNHQSYNFTRIDNTYINAEDMTRIYIQRYGKFGYLCFNGSCATSMPSGTNDTLIGKANIPSLIQNYYFNVPAQNSNATVICSLLQDGTLKIANFSGTALSGFFRAFIPIMFA